MVRRVLVGGEAVPREALAAWLKLGRNEIQLDNCYGPTEATITATVTTLDPRHAERIGN